MPARRISAAWLIPAGRAPIADGAVLIDAAGRIAEVGPEQSVSRPVGILTEAFADAVLLPGLINSHTHLELTGFGGQVPEPDFAGWIRHLIQLKAGRSPEQMREAARLGIRQGWAQGVTTVADTGDSAAAIHAMAELSASGIAYQEIFGPHPDSARQQLDEFAARFDQLRALAGPRIRLGLSPHAPYSVSGPLYALVAQWAERENLPLAVHVAESLEESELIGAGRGPFADQWRRRGIPLPDSGGATPIEWLDHHGIVGPRTLCIHAVRAGSGDVDRLRRRGAAVAHCPRSNRRHAGAAAPVAAYLAAGIRVGVGTDSVASASPLDLWAEARLAALQAGLSAESAVALITSGAAAAIGMAAEVGALCPGLWGDVAVIGLSSSGPAESVHQRLLQAGPSDVLQTVLAGREVYRRAAA